MLGQDRIFVKNKCDIPKFVQDSGGSRITKRAASIDKGIEKETPEYRTIRAQLRLSDHWEVVSKEVETYLPEYDDDHPDAPDRASG